MKKYLLTIASLIAVVSLTGLAQLSTALAKSGHTARVTPHAHALSEAAVRADIRSGKLRRVTAQQAAKLNAQTKKAQAKVGTRTVGNYYIGRYQEQGRLWYDEYCTYEYYSSNYEVVICYKNWIICTSGYPSSGYCLDTNLYDYESWIYYYGTWYGPYGPYGPYTG